MLSRWLVHPLRAVVGVLKGYDQLMNLVLDEAVEYLRGERQQHALDGAALLRCTHQYRALACHDDRRHCAPPTACCGWQADQAAPQKPRGQW